MDMQQLFLEPTTVALTLIPLIRVPLDGRPITQFLLIKIERLHC